MKIYILSGILEYSTKAYNLPWYCGFHCDRYGRRIVIFVSIVSTFVCTLSLAWASSFAVYCFLRFTIGVSTSVMYNTGFVLGKKKRKKSDSVPWQKPLYQQKIPKAKWQHKNFDYTTTADRLRTVSWSNDNHPTGVVKPVYAIPTFPLTAEA